MSDIDDLGRVAVALVVTYGEPIGWADLSAADENILRGALNDGIPQDDVDLIRANEEDDPVVAAMYRDEENDFTAEYLLFRGAILFSFED